MALYDLQFQGLAHHGSRRSMWVGTDEYYSRRSVSWDCLHSFNPPGCSWTGFDFIILLTCLMHFIHLQLVLVRGLLGFGLRL